MEERIPTLCWYCRNAVPNPSRGTGCNWSIAFRPVPGWEVEQTVINAPFNGYLVGRTVDSYHVKSCPMYRSDCDDKPKKFVMNKGAPRSSGNHRIIRMNCLREIIKARGYTYDDFARLSGLSVHSIRDYVYFKTNIPDKNLSVLMDKLNVTADEIFSEHYTCADKKKESWKTKAKYSGGNVFQWIRAENDIRRDELARAAGMGVNTLKYVERQKIGQVSPHNMVRLCKALGMTQEELLKLWRSEERILRK